MELSLMIYIVGVVLLLGLLIFFHEFGHFLVARYFGVRVEVFSFGFGPKLAKIRRGETDYCLSAIPLGGYVKLFGEQPDAEIPAAERMRSFSHKPAYQRFLIALAGPTANFILALVVFFLIGLTGEPMPTSAIPHVVVGSEAWKAGFRSGDQISAINGQPVSLWEEVKKSLANQKSGDMATIDLNRPKRDGAFERKIISLPLHEIPTTDLYGRATREIQIEGVLPRKIAPYVGVDSPNSPAALAGIKTGDLLLAIDDQAVSTWGEAEHLLSEMNTAPPTLTIERLSPDAGQSPEIGLKANAETVRISTELPDWNKFLTHRRLSSLGLYSSEFFIGQVAENLPAAKAGLQVGDHIVALNNLPVTHFEAFQLSIRELGERGEPFTLEFVREGKRQKVTLSPTEKEGRDGRKAWMIGVASMGVSLPPDLHVVRSFNPLVLARDSALKFWHWTAVTVKSFALLLTGQMSLKMIGGPIMIGKLAGDTLRIGLYPFLQILAIISINLGVLNLLPIPVLDGGHLVFHGVEWIFRRPIHPRVQEIATQIGFGLLLLLIAVVLYNDIARYWGGLTKFFH